MGLERLMFVKIDKRTLLHRERGTYKKRQKCGEKKKKKTDVRNRKKKKRYVGNRKIDRLSV